jgi:hypothetical protein
MKTIPIAVFAVLALGAVGCGDSKGSSGASRDAPNLVSHPACAGGGRAAGASPRDLVYSHCPANHHQAPPNGGETIRHRAGLCFTDAELRLDAGEALGSIAPGQRFPGRHRIVHKYFETTIGNLVRSLRTADRFADADTRPPVDRITRLVHVGIRQLRRHPSLIVHGGIDAFHRADAIARRAGLRSCLT